VAGGWALRIYSFETLPSTQTWLTEKIVAGEVDPPCAVIARSQTDGIGSRGNRWIGKKGNFFASIALFVDDLPDDLPLTAASIYFSYLMKRVLAQRGSKIWVKWPNDFYLDQRKVGGCITAKKGETVIAGIGLNLLDAPRDFGVLDIEIDPETLLDAWLAVLKETPSWKQIFSNYAIEFEKSKKFETHHNNERISLKSARLMRDGSVMIGEKRVVSLR
jgi:BirA family biotin operon repressor/biotin-[acetyl-CoA-carboxylase] ligase